MSTTTDIRVLHVDDNPRFGDLVSRYLEREDDRIEVVTAHDATEGQGLLEDGRIECVVSDFDMPGTDGLEFLQSVRESDPNLPFVLFTGKGSEEIASRAISAGITDYLQKGGGSEQYAVLANRIRNAVGRYRAERRVERGYEALESAREGIGILDEDGTFTYVNEAYADLVGYRPDELIGERWELLYPSDRVDRLHDEVLSTVATTGRWTGETEYVRKDDGRVLVDQAVSICAEGSIICLIEGLSERPDRVERLVSDAAILERILDAFGDAMLVFDPDGAVLHATEEAASVSGYDRDDLERMRAYQLVIEADWEPFEERIRTAVRAGEATLATELVTSDGSEVPFEFRMRGLDGGHDDAAGVVAVGRRLPASTDGVRRRDGTEVGS